MLESESLTGDKIAIRRKDGTAEIQSLCESQSNRLYAKVNCMIGIIIGLLLFFMQSKSVPLIFVLQINALSA